MNRLFDLLLAKPLPEAWLQGLLFFAFTLHLLFVLITLGTAILAVFFFVDFHWRGRSMELLLDRRILRTFMAHKSLAVVLGVAPLLLMQIAFATSFFTAANLLAPYWMFIIALLIIAFLSFDILGHGIETHRRYHLAIALVALPCLLLVPGIFVAVLTTAENSGQWLAMANHGFPAHRTPGVALALPVPPYSGGLPGPGRDLSLFLYRQTGYGQGGPPALDRRRGLVASPPGPAPVHFITGEARSHRSGGPGRRGHGHGPAARGDFRGRPPGRPPDPEDRHPTVDAGPGGHAPHPAVAAK